MSGIKYIGRTTDFRGKTLWEIVGNLRDFGVGRLVVRNMFQRYPEPCYMRILNVQAVDAKEGEERKVRVTVERTWRGVTLPKSIEIYSSSYKADYALVPKDEEAKYLQNTNKVQEKVIPNKLEFPPFLRELIAEETGKQEPLMNVHFKKHMQKFVRKAENNEKPTVELSMSLGKPASSNLYKDVL